MASTPERRRVPVSTYRLQLHGGFGFDAAAGVVPYLARLGISHLYLSPILQAAPGSEHGYDVVDHDQVSADLGGEDGLEQLADAAHRHGLGLVVDVVPNHMAIPAPEYLNAPLWQLLREGCDAGTARWFDVDWEHTGGRFPLPFLGDSLEQVLAAGELTLGEHEGEQVVRYYEHAFPVAPGTEGDDVGDVLDRQHYLLAHWRDKDDVLAYRRFFDIDTLVAVRVEDAVVFDATHRLLLDLHARGVIDGFRIDHPDGLADPEGYLERLRDATDGAWVVVEKILEGEEALPASWPCAGSTGYDALRAVQHALLPPTGEALEAVWADVVGRDTDLADVERLAKQEVVFGSLQPEVRRLTRVAVRAAQDAGESLGHGAAGEALGELLVQMDAYRAYVTPGKPVDAAAAARLSAAVERAHVARRDLTRELVLLERMLLDTGTESVAGRDLIVRYQQTCGPVMAKGVEDTTFYRWHELVALDEVGGDPEILDDPSVAALHAWARRQVEEHPLGLTSLSTHDTKRSEDVRARLLAAAANPPAWRAAWEPVRAAAEELGVDRPTAYLMLQTVVGAWPIDVDRLNAYLVKATREAKRRTTWIDPVEDYEGRVKELSRKVVEDTTLRSAITKLLDGSADAIRATTLAAKLLQLTMPGVPDVYQGCETVDLSLVDPDNRRPVDYTGLDQRLAALDAGTARDGLPDEKLHVTSQALRLRRRNPEHFTGPGAGYEPLAGTGPHLIGFVRGQQVVTLATRWPARLAAAGGWGPAEVRLPDGRWTDILTGATSAGGSQPVAGLLTALPVALLVRS